MSLSLHDIRLASDRIRGRAVRTPLLEAHATGAATGARVFVKPEVLQRTGSFKFRGAMSRLSLLTADERKRGVVAFSSGNHAQAVACAARDLGTPSVIVMPADAPRLKIENTRGYGAEVVLYDRLTEDRVAIGKRLSTERGLVLVPPYDDFHVMAGQGTIGLELADDAQAQGVAFDLVLVPASGGGLAAGIATALKALSPGTRVIAVEPQNYNDIVRSFAAGERVANKPCPQSICDALMVDMPGELTFPLLQAAKASAVAVSDEEALRAMAHAFYQMKLVVEPGGAAGLAALLSGKVDARAKTIGVVLSGGNVDAEMFGRALNS
ncbi:MAG: threonine/serine dehydratase [Micropepsaceae bacterium]